MFLIQIVNYTGKIFLIFHKQESWTILHLGKIVSGKNSTSGKLHVIQHIPIRNLAADMSDK